MCQRCPFSAMWKGVMNIYQTTDGARSSRTEYMVGRRFPDPEFPYVVIFYNDQGHGVYEELPKYYEIA